MTAGHTLTMAAVRALAIPELLEAILVELPTLDHLRIQKVNTSFRAVIQRSSTTQQKLFFKPPTPRGNDTITINPLLVRCIRYHSTNCPYVTLPLQQSNMFSSYYLCTFRSVYSEADFCVSADCGLTLDLRKADGQFRTLDLPFGSFKDLLIADAPIPVSVEAPEGGFETLSKSGDVDIVTLGEVIEALHRASLEEKMEFIGWTR